MSRLVPWQTRPLGLFESLRREMDELMNRFGVENGTDGGWFAPSTNLAETEKEFEITVDLPGMKAENFNVELREGTLWITGERKQEKEEKGKSWLRVERAYGQFKRGIALGPDVDADHVEAEYKDGVLRVTVPKTPAACPRKISVKA